MKKLNRKGFTLIELLAVIVILAVLILVAVTAVIPMMERSQKQAFITEATTILNAAETYNLYHEMTSGTKNCIDIQEDLIGEYVDEKGKGAYDGTVTIDADGKYTISLTDGKNFFIAIDEDAIANAGEKDVKEKQADAAGYKASCS